MKNDFIKKQTQQKQTQKKKGVPKWQVWLLLAFMVLWTIGSVLGGVAFVKADVPTSYAVTTDKPFDTIPNTTDLYGYDSFTMPNNSNFDKFSDKVILIDNSYFENNTTMQLFCKYSSSTSGTGNLSGLSFRNYLTGSNYTNTFHVYVDILYQGEHYIFRIYDYIMNKTSDVGTFIYIPSGIITCSVGDYTIDISLGTANPISSLADKYIPYMKTFDYDLSYSNAYKYGYDLGYEQGYKNGSEFVYNSLLDGLFTNASTQYGLSCYSSYYESMTGVGSWNIPFTLDISPKGDIIDFSTLYSAIVQNNNTSNYKSYNVDFGSLEIDLSYPLYFGGITLKSTIYNTSSVFRLYSSITDTYYNCTFSIEDGSIIPLDNLSNIIIDKIIIDYTGNPMSTFFDGSYLQVVGQNNTPFYEAFNSGYYKGLEEAKKLDYTKAYNNGFTAGEQSAKDYWYNQGMNDANQYTFFNLIASVVDAPLSVISNFLNFDILGFNMASFFFSLMTLCIVLIVVRLVLMKM